MVRVNLWFGLLGFAAVLDAIALPPHYEVHERRENVNTRWTRLGRIDSQTLLPMRIGLAQTDLEDGYEHLMKV
jgi:tripeptidyl-peptidase-1